MNAKSTTLALSSLLLLAACRPDGPGLPVEVEPSPFCLLGTLPFSPQDRDWRDDNNENLSELLPRIKHQPADILANDDGVYAYTDLPGDAALSSGNYVVRGVVARTKDTQGLVSNAIPGELVSLWEEDATGTWTEIGDQLSASSGTVGQYEIDLGTDEIDGEVALQYSVLNPESSCAVHGIFQFDRGRKVIITDIDETMTIADEEIFIQIEDEGYDQVEKPFSVELTQAWAAKGYQVIYLTARPHVFRAETRAWLRFHGYADGPMITAPELVLGEAARVYKRDWVNRIIDDLGWDIVAAYGNAESDIDAYEDAGLDKAVTFIIGENAGANGTAAIANDSFADHIEAYVNQQPDA